MRQEALNYVQNQLVRAEARLEGYLKNPTGERNNTRNIIVKIRQYYKGFLGGTSDQRWVIMPGLRGVGKTTVMAQTFFEVLAEFKKMGLSKNHAMFVSLDDVVENLGTSLQEIMEAYELVLGVAFEKQQKPILLFIDEAQYDPKWGVVLKTLFDKSRHIFIFFTP